MHMKYTRHMYMKLWYDRKQYCKNTGESQYSLVKLKANCCRMQIMNTTNKTIDKDKVEHEDYSTCGLPYWGGVVKTT